MKKQIGIGILALLIFSLAGSFAFAAGGLDVVKSLAGQWKGKTASGNDVNVTYSLASGGTMVLENLDMGKEQMTTTYYQDGKSVMLTHYCMANNQPRMKAEIPADAKKVVFGYVDATNLSSPDAGRMKQLVLTLQDQDHITQEWTWDEKGSQKVEKFELARVH